MKFEDIKKLLLVHRGKAVIGAGLIPVAVLVWKKRGIIRNGVKGIGALARGKKTAVSGLSEARKTDMVNTVRFMLGEYNTAPFNIIYNRAKKEGRMGYSMRSDAKTALFFGWSDAFMAAHPVTPFWIELDARATEAFRDRGLKQYYDIYINPEDECSILVSVPLEEIEDPRAVAGKIMELASKTLL